MSRCCWPSVCSPGSRSPLPPRRGGLHHQDDRITESSGLARDAAAGPYWTVNDSGDGGTAYGLSPTGKILGTLNYRAQPDDVEAVAVHEDRLYVADIGDNNDERDFVTVYYFDDPRPAA